MSKNYLELQPHYTMPDQSDSEEFAEELAEPLVKRPQEIAKSNEPEQPSID